MPRLIASDVDSCVWAGMTPTSLTGPPSPEEEAEGGERPTPARDRREAARPEAPPELIRDFFINPFLIQNQNAANFFPLNEKKVVIL